LESWKLDDEIPWGGHHQGIMVPKDVCGSWVEEEERRTTIIIRQFISTTTTSTAPNNSQNPGWVALCKPETIAEFLSKLS